MPRAVVVEIARAGRRIDKEIVRVLGVGEVDRGVARIVDLVEDCCGHVREHFTAIVGRGGGRVVAACVEGPGTEAVQEAVIRADVDHVGARLLARDELAVRLRRVLRRRRGGVQTVRPCRGVRQ